MKERPVLGIVVPCYNEEAVLGETIAQLDAVLSALIAEELISGRSFMLFVDDGSKDRTWELIAEHRAFHPHVAGLKLAGNVGHQSALLAGLMEARVLADCVISIDADLQDDVRVIRDFVLKYIEGFEIVYGVRRSRDTDTWFKRTTALGFYRFMDRMGVKVVNNHADYRLMSRRALDELERFKEVNLFLRGLVPMIGFRSTSVYYDRLERFAGESKYPLRRMIAFALEGITSLSIRPIRLVTAAGFIMFGVSLLAALYAIIAKLTGEAVSGWTSLIVSIWFIGGVQLVSLGLIGEYVGKIYREVKRRPLYTVETELLPESLQHSRVAP
ncbi:glycosyltransferase involved in cell wall biosynthesis [Paenibacillus phyllosphaerae]|uniref:Glycosyltransferase involved in cell wall biosynthesis n=1 Tax=Paenibacillus phyllosphaerae TaxID=274593 RepID=A0A7W5AV54_9BACL|nr:glycosyltransferase family 2 protein [Paenibacillus phyllosphaerae]MBB3108756.1 glycosyltransferase involved in cell wall biosynthesis [Paenibacillus phyllosphaerae]